MEALQVKSALITVAGQGICRANACADECACVNKAGMNADTRADSGVAT